MNDADANPFASPVATDDPPPVDDRPRLRGRPVFWPMTLAPVVTAAALPLAIAAIVGIGQLLPAGISWPRSMPGADEMPPILGGFAGVSSTLFAVLVAPATWWGWRRNRLTPLAIRTAATFTTALCLLVPSVLFSFLEPTADETEKILVVVIGAPLLIGVPVLTPVLLYAWWLNRLVREARKPGSEPGSRRTCSGHGVSGYPGGPPPKRFTPPPRSGLSNGIPRSDRR